MLSANLSQDRHVHNYRSVLRYDHKLDIIVRCEPLRKRKIYEDSRLESCGFLVKCEISKCRILLEHGCITLLDVLIYT